ncbi:MAG: hypothetical protein WBZ20_06815, partial [Nitrososphaeraceae archaeon]
NNNNNNNNSIKNKSIIENDSRLTTITTSEIQSIIKEEDVKSLSPLSNIQSNSASHANNVSQASQPSVENRDALQENDDNASQASQISDRGGEHILQQQENRFKCFHCNEFYSSDGERVAHISAEHPSRLYYPNPEDFDNRLNR